jgi:Arc/MetJ family transcription regulator
VARTNLDVDEDLVAEAMRRYGLTTKRAAVDFALRQLVGSTMTRDELLAMEGTGWSADMSDMRSDDVADLE